MPRTILYLDGENLKHYLKKVLVDSGIKEKDAHLENFDLASLLAAPLKGIRVSQKRYYSAKIRLHQETAKQSLELILKQRI